MHKIPGSIRGAALARNPVSGSMARPTNAPRSADYGPTARSAAAPIDAAQKNLGAVLLAGGKLAVDQDIAHRAGKTANGGIAKLDMKAGQQGHHFIGGGGLVGGKETCRIGLRALLSRNRFFLKSRESADKRQQADSTHDYYFFP